MPLTKSCFGEEPAEVPLETPNASPVSAVSFAPLSRSRYIQPQQISYDQLCVDGKRRHKTWDILKSHDAVAVLVLDTDRQAFVLVRQFRAAVFARASEEQRQRDPSCGFTLELPAGIVDKPLPLAAIAAEEVLEETGYDSPASALREITTGLGNVGMAASALSLFYLEVDASMRKTKGGGLLGEGESIEVVYLPLAEAETFLETKDGGTGFATGMLAAFYWYFWRSRQPSWQARLSRL